MKCMVCYYNMAPYFTKKFDNYGLNDVEYWQCEQCGLVMSKTHNDMGKNKWNKLNKLYHRSYLGSEADPYDPRWIFRLNKQAEVIADLKDLGLLNTMQPWIDYGCGDGKLSESLFDEYNIEISKYDKAINGPGFLSVEDLSRDKFGLVISTSVFEHLLNTVDLELINGLVSENGVLALHTFVAEKIQRDPLWFYLLPTHCTFFTNKSMQILFERWEYQASIYHVESRLWFWFKNNIDELEDVIRSVNNMAGREGLYYHFKRGFVDFWK